MFAVLALHPRGEPVHGGDDEDNWSEQNRRQLPRHQDENDEGRDEGDNDSNNRGGRIRNHVLKLVDIAGEHRHDLSGLTLVVIRGFHRNQRPGRIHSEVVLDVVTKRLPGIFRDALENRQEQEAKKNQDTVAIRWVTVNARDHVLDDLRPGEGIGGEVIHGQANGDEGHQVKETGRCIRENTCKDTFWILFSVRDHTPNLPTENFSTLVDVFGSHHVFLAPRGMGSRHVCIGMNMILEPSVSSKRLDDAPSNLS